MSKRAWCSLLKKKINKYALNHLKQECSLKYKAKALKYDTICIQPYFKTLSTSDSRLMFQIRSSMIDIKTCRAYKYDDNLCRLCKTEREDVDHILNCPNIRRELVDKRYHVIVKRVQIFLHKVEETN